MPRFPYQDVLPVTTQTTAAETIKKGDGVVVGDSVFIAAEDKQTVAATDFTISCWAAGQVIEGVPRRVADAAWTRGAKIYWDSANNHYTNVATGHELAGIARAATTGGATVGDIYYPGPIVQD